MRPRLRLFVGAIVVAGGVMIAAMACGPGDLHYLMAGDGSSPTEPEGQDASDPCKHARVPGRPAAKLGETTVLPLTFAAEDLRVDTGGGEGLLAPATSLDLDDTCTCSFGAGSSCILPPDAGACDGDGGRDNVTGPLIEFAAGLLPILQPSFLRDRIKAGFYSVLVRVSGWNGTNDDDRVAVGIMMSPSIDGPKDENANLIPPKFDGNDAWTVEEGSVVDGHTLVGQVCDGDINCHAIATDFNAYVAGGLVVANFETIPFAFGSGSERISIPFQDAILTAKIAAKDVNGAKAYTTEGEIAGRWPADAIIAAVARASVDKDGTTESFCTNPLLFATFKQGVCTAVDLADRKANDGKKKKCTAMSQAIRFKGSQAKLGIVKESSTETGGESCPPNLDTSCHF